MEAAGQVILTHTQEEHPRRAWSVDPRPGGGQMIPEGLPGGETWSQFG